MCWSCISKCYRHMYIQTLAQTFIQCCTNRCLCFLLSNWNTGFCPHWSVVVGPNHHSENFTTTQLWKQLFYHHLVFKIVFLPPFGLKNVQTDQILTTTQSSLGRTQVPGTRTERVCSFPGFQSWPFLLCSTKTPFHIASIVMDGHRGKFCRCAYLWRKT